jgi:uncharacterized protein (TIGR03118 family)
MQTVDGAVFKGVALSGNGSALQLYVTDFANGQIDVFDGSFAPVTLSGNAFKDGTAADGQRRYVIRQPAARYGTYHPFGIQAIGGNIYVTYAKTQAGSTDEAHGPGTGFVDVYDPNGTLIKRVASRGVLNAPWGLALAPAGFGEFGGALLVGNFGDGRINAFDPVNGSFLARCAMRIMSRSSSKACGDSRSATAPRTSRSTRCSSRQDRTTKPTDCMDASMCNPATATTAAIIRTDRDSHEAQRGRVTRLRPRVFS